MLYGISSALVLSTACLSPVPGGSFMTVRSPSSAAATSQVHRLPHSKGRSLANPLRRAGARPARSSTNSKSKYLARPVFAARRDGTLRVGGRSTSGTEVRLRGRGKAVQRHARVPATFGRDDTYGRDLDTQLALDAGATQAERLTARLSLVLVACLYGTNYTAMKLMGASMETTSLLALRFGLASLILVPSLKGVRADVLLAGAEVGVYATLGYWSQALALKAVPASQVALVACLAVLVVPFLDQMSGRRPANAARVCAALLACGGAVLLQGGGTASTAGDEVTIMPRVLALAQPLFFGLSTWRMEAHAASKPGMALPLTAAQVVVIGAASLLWGSLAGGLVGVWNDALASFGTNSWSSAILAWLGLVNTALVLFLETDALATVSASEATVIYSLEPLVGAGLAGLLLRESFGTSTALGASLVLGGCLCSSLGDTAQAREPVCEDE